MAIDEFGGTIDGTPVMMLSADNQNKPDVGVTIARKWIDVDHVDALFDISNSALALGVQTLATNAKVPALFSEALTLKLTGEACSPFGIQWSFNSHALADIVARAAVREGAKTWFFITSDSEYGQLLQLDATWTTVRVRSATRSSSGSGRCHRSTRPRSIRRSISIFRW